MRQSGRLASHRKSGDFIDAPNDNNTDFYTELIHMVVPKTKTEKLSLEELNKVVPHLWMLIYYADDCLEFLKCQQV